MGGRSPTDAPAIAGSADSREYPKLVCHVVARTVQRRSTSLHWFSMEVGDR